MSGKGLDAMDRRFERQKRRRVMRMYGPEIVSRYGAGERVVDLADDFGLSKQEVWSLLRDARFADRDLKRRHHAARTMMDAPKVARARGFAARVDAGESMAAIGRSERISRERVRQLVDWAREMGDAK